MGYPVGYDYDTLFDAITRLSKFVKSHDTYYMKGKEKGTEYALLPEDGYYYIDLVTDKKTYKTKPICLCGDMSSKNQKYEIRVHSQELLDELGEWLTELTKRYEDMLKRLNNEG